MLSISSSSNPLAYKPQNTRAVTSCWVEVSLQLTKTSHCHCSLRQSYLMGVLVVLESELNLAVPPDVALSACAYP